jgi:hypothetical protein
MVGTRALAFFMTGGIVKLSERWAEEGDFSER